MPYNILIVDDSETVRAVIAKTLDIIGVPRQSIYQAGDGREGLEILRKQKISLVFSDINMPVMNGVEMIAEIKKDPELKSVPIVVVSTEGSKTRIEELRAMGISDYLRKPFTPEQFKNIIDALLGGPDGTE